MMKLERTISVCSCGVKDQGEMVKCFFTSQPLAVTEFARQLKLLPLDHQIPLHERWVNKPKVLTVRLQGILQEPLYTLYGRLKVTAEEWTKIHNG